MEDRKKAIVADLTAAREGLLQLAGGLAAADWQRPAYAEGWTVRDILAHLTAAEPGNITIARRILNGEEGFVPEFDLNRWNARQVAKRQERTVPELLNDVAEARQETLHLLDSLTEEDLSKQGRRTTGEITTVEGVFYQIARHERAHTEDMRRAVAGSGH